MNTPEAAPEAARPVPKRLAFLLGGLVALSPIATDSFLAAMPAVGRAFEADAAAVQATLGLYFLGFAVGQLVHGPLSDRFGRRPVVLAGLGILTMASFAAAFAPDLATLAACRFVQSFGLAAGWLLSRAIVRDLFAMDRAAAMLSLLALIGGLGPLLGSIVGGALVMRFDWWAALLFVGVAAAIAWLVGFAKLPETNTRLDPTATDFGRFFRNAGVILRERRFRAAFAVFALSFGGLYAFLAGSAYVLIEGMGLTPTEYGVCFALTQSGNLVGAALGARLATRIGIAKVLAIGTAIAAVGGVALLVLAWDGAAHPATVVAPMAVYFLGFSMTHPQALATALTPFPYIAGTASTLIGFLQQCLGSLVGVLVSAAFDGTARPMAVAVAVTTILTALAYWTAFRPMVAARA
ncbi:MAG: multidrug effflux MFS transporter [Alphaproteobacteria bacterium]|nr:multidrug effflux MFS transporter [Alphaproteobacteria bacterium]